MRKNKGITLIALVITIIVLLILAGITISVVFGENGLLNQAGKAKESSDLASLREDVDIKVAQNDAQKKSNLEYYLKQIPDATVEKAGEDVFYVKRGSAVITVYENGDIEETQIDIWDGTTSESPEFKDFNWYIYNTAQLKFFADFVNNGNALTESQKTLVAAEGYNESDIVITDDTIVYLMANLDLGARQVNGTLTSGTAWTPIGTTNALKFTGTFEGNNHYIKGVYVNTTSNFNGLFGNSDTIQNLTIKDSYIKGATCTGGIVGAFREGTIANCNNIDTIVILAEGEYRLVGGIVGQFTGTEIKGCSNTGKVTAYGMSSESSQCGGVVGFASTSSTVTNCTNTGKVTGEGDYVGGVVGYASTSATVTNCNNTGTVSGASDYVGGVAGFAFTSSTVTNCTNTGTVTGDGNYVGGVVAGVHYQEVIITNCYNTGAVTGGGTYIGGVLGIIFTDSQDVSTIEQPSKIMLCYNTGTINGYKNTGGVVGSICQYASEMEKCYNIGVVKGNQMVGGLSGELGRGSSIKNCYNTASVEGNMNVAGIVGYTYKAAGSVINCYSKGKTIGETNVGGIIGNNANESTITNCYYLTGCAELDVGNGTATDLSKDAEYIKTTFMSTANSESTVWKIESGKNDGYPVLIME